MTVAALVLGVILGRATLGGEAEATEMVDVQRLVTPAKNLDRWGAIESRVEVFVPDIRIECDVWLSTDSPPRVWRGLVVEHRDEPSWKELEALTGPNLRVEKMKLPRKLVQELRELADLSAKVTRESERLQGALREAGILAIPASR